MKNNYRSFIVYTWFNALFAFALLIGNHNKLSNFGSTGLALAVFAVIEWVLYYSIFDLAKDTDASPKPCEQKVTPPLYDLGD
jgi:hypothetical protein